MNSKAAIAFGIVLCIAVIPLARADYWDQTSGVAFSQPMQSAQVLAYNVTAVAQSDPDGIGPVYLLNGLTNAGYWYQIGISYNWSIQGNSSLAELGHADGFQMTYDVFNPNGTVIAPVCRTEACGGALSLSGPVHSGDKVLLSMSVAGGNVVMRLKDWNTGASADLNFSGNGATAFQGTLYPPNYAGFFTGLMTEWYHNNAYYYKNGSPMYYQEQKVVYTPYGNGPTNGWLFLFKICGPAGCLDSNTNVGYVIANVKDSAGTVSYTPKNTTLLQQSDLPYNFTSYDGQAALLYQNGTFQTGTLKPTFTTTTTTTTTISTSTSSTTTTVMPVGSTATTTVQASMVRQAVQNGSVQAQNVAPSAGSAQRKQGQSVALALGIVAIAAAVLLGLYNARRMRKIRIQQQ